MKSFSIISSTGEIYHLSKSEILIGSSEKCDILLNDRSVSYYHALFLIKNNILTIINLTTNHIFKVNNYSVNRSLVNEDDEIQIGENQFKILCDFSDFTEKSHLEKKSHLNIKQDIEYFNYVFNDSSFNLMNENPLKFLSFSSKEFIELEGDQNIFDIINKSEEKAIKITKFISGNIIETNYLEIKDGNYFASSSEKAGDFTLDLLNKNDRLLFFKIQNEKVTIIKNEIFSGIAKDTVLEENNIIILFQGVYQIFIEIDYAPSEILKISTLSKEKDFLKDTLINYATMVIPMLFLLLVNFDIPTPPKKLSVIYRPPSKTINKNIKKESITKTEKTSHSKATVKKVSKKISKTSINSSINKLKAYEFKFSKLPNIFNSNENIKVKTASRGVTSSNKVNLNSALSNNLDKSKLHMGGNRLNTDISPRGFGYIAGNETAYVEPKTVILGSMDPELLRKILQQYLPQFRHCYQKELLNNSEDIKGIVDLNFEISSKGKVGKINIKTLDTRFSEKGTNCMAQVLRIIDFPKPKGGGKVAVRQPLNFYSEKERG